MTDRKTVGMIALLLCAIAVVTVSVITAFRTGDPSGVYVFDREVNGGVVSGAVKQTEIHLERNRRVTVVFGGELGTISGTWERDGDTVRVYCGGSFTRVYEKDGDTLIDRDGSTIVYYRKK